MPIESATYVNQLVLTNPTSADKKKTSDDHIKLIKSVITNSFSNLGNNAISASAGEMNQLVGVTATLQTSLNFHKTEFVGLTSGATTAGNALEWHGSGKYVSTASASGGSAGDIWFQFEN